MLVRLLSARSLAKDGIHITRHEAGETIDLSPALAAALVRDGHAESAEEDPGGLDAALERVLDTEEQAKSSSTPHTAKKKYRNRGD